MPFKMHADARRRLLDALAEVIPLLEVRKGIFLERGQAYALLHFTEKILPSKGALRDQLVSYIDELPITEFVTDTLSYEPQSGEYKNEGPNQKRDLTKS